MPYRVNLKNLQNSATARSENADTRDYFWEQEPSAAGRAFNGRKELFALFFLFSATLAAAFFVGIVYLRPSSAPISGSSASQAAAASVGGDTSSGGGSPLREDAFQSLSLAARGAVVYDVARKQTAFARDAKRPLPLASLTKIMTALAAMEILEDDEAVTITPYAIATEGDNGLTTGEVWRAGDLAAYMLITSSNDAAQALAQAAGLSLLSEEEREEEATPPNPPEAVAAFVAHMNRLAQTWGLDDLQFRNPSGLDLPEGKAGAVGSARDVALLFLRLMRERPELARATREERVVFTTQDGKEHTARNTNRLVHILPGLLAGKTGYTEIAGGNLAILADLGMGMPMAIVVLGSSFEERFTDVEQLLGAAFLYRGGLGEQ